MFLNYKLFFKKTRYIFLIFFILLFLFQFSFVFGSDSEEEMSEEDFINLLEENPVAGFREDSQRAWNHLMQTPQKLVEYGINAIEAAFRDDQTKFVDLVQRDINLLGNSDVREFYERAISQDSLLITRNPEAFNEFLNQNDIRPPQSLESFQLTYLLSEHQGESRGVLSLRREDGKTVVTSINHVSEIFDDGSVEIQGTRIYNGHITELRPSEYIVRSLNSENSVEIGVRGEIFTSRREISFGLDDGLNYIQTQRDESIHFMFDETRRSQRELMGRLTFDGEDRILGVNSELKYYDIVISDTPALSRREIVRSISTQKELRVTPSDCKNSQNCIIMTQGNQGEHFDVRVSQDNQLDLNFYRNDPIGISINQGRGIEDESQVRIESMYEESRSVLEVTKNGFENLRGFMDPQTQLRIRHATMGPNGLLNEQILGMGEEDGRISFRTLSQQEIDEGLNCNENNICRIGQYNYERRVVTINGEQQVLYFNQFYYNELGQRIDPNSGNVIGSSVQVGQGVWIEQTNSGEVGFQMPEIFSLGGVDINVENILNCDNQGVCRVGENQGFVYQRTEITIEETGELVILYLARDGNYYNEFGDEIDIETGNMIGESVLKSRGFWVDRELLNPSLFSPTSVIEDFQWAPSGCTEMGQQCPIALRNGGGVIQYQVGMCGDIICFEARDGEIFNERGEMVDRDGNFINRAGESCDNACDVSFYQDYFRGGRLESEAPGRSIQTVISTSSGVTNTGDIANPSRSTTLRDAVVSDPSFDRISYAYSTSNIGKYRNYGVNPVLERILQATAEEVGVRVSIFSGGQMSEAQAAAVPGSWKVGSSWYARDDNGRRISLRTGSDRHDFGNAVDINLIDQNGRQIPLSDPRFTQFISVSIANGARGVGAHDAGYMGEFAMHLDVESPAVWGLGGRSANSHPRVDRAVDEGYRLRCERHGVTCR